MIHADLTQHQSYTLTQSGSNRIKDTVKGQFQRHLMMLASPKHRNADTEERHQHRHNAHRRHLLPQRHPCHQGCRQRGQRHKKLPVARTYYYIALKETEVTNDIAHES